MTVTKIVVYIAHHDDALDKARVVDHLESALASEFGDLLFEVRDEGSHVVTLASIVDSLEQRTELAYATVDGTPVPVG